MNKIKIILMMIISLFVFTGCSSDDPGKIKLDYSAVENSSNANKIKVEKSVIDSLNESLLILFILIELIIVKKLM